LEHETDPSEQRDPHRFLEKGEKGKLIRLPWQGQRGKAKKFHSNPENEGGFNSKWEEEQGQSGSLQRQHVRLEQRGTEHMAQRMEEQLKQGPTGGFLE
jgi:hypothetical protein